LFACQGARGDFLALWKGILSLVCSSGRTFFKNTRKKERNDSEDDESKEEENEEAGPLYVKISLTD
jgi:hypothetical protein